MGRGFRVIDTEMGAQAPVINLSTGNPEQEDC